MAFMPIHLSKGSCWNLPDLVIKRPLSDWRESPEKVPDLPENEELKGKNPP